MVAATSTTFRPSVFGKAVLALTWGSSWGVLASIGLIVAAVVALSYDPPAVYLATVLVAVYPVLVWRAGRVRVTIRGDGHLQVVNLLRTIEAPPGRWAVTSSNLDAFRGSLPCLRLVTDSQSIPMQASAFLSEREASRLRSLCLRQSNAAALGRRPHQG